MAATTEASSVKTQLLTEGLNMFNSTVVPANSQPVFNFGDNQVRVIVRDGEPWFVATDVCRALGYRDAEKGTRNLSNHQKADTQIVGSSSGGVEQLRKVTIINESGLYRLVLRSRKPEAEKFSDWVTGEVLPTIRKTGQYQQPVAQTVPAIDYARISPAQAQDLKEIVAAIVQAGIQGYGETWARFQRKFKVNSYLELPATQHLEARQYLIAKLPDGYSGVVHEENVPLERLEPALSAANAVAMKIQYAALMAMMKSEDLRRGRWMVSFGYGADAEPSVAQVEHNACVLPVDKFHLAIEDSISVDPQTLMQLASTCMRKLTNMAAHGTKALPA
ncbi:MAG: Bro-N domain-containing protein [Comamonas sp.]|nr:Bro-N domain-containing protein [Comamonas sp.]